MLADPCRRDPPHGYGSGCDVDLSAGFLTSRTAVHRLHECHKRLPERGGEPKHKEQALAIHRGPQDELMSRKGKLIHVSPNGALVTVCGRSASWSPSKDTTPSTAKTSSIGYGLNQANFPEVRHQVSTHLL